ncbi:hypothetical protein V8G61_14515 [Gaetbulibacter sp. M240]|uniref:hypothetical protein n=1 Tax=Gaetbulibacter sp. M240 TaxID=3126511 RepID=UPI00374E311B
MKYLIKDIDDLNNSFVINPYESLYFQGVLKYNEGLRQFNIITRSYNFHKSENAIFNSIKFFNSGDFKNEIKKEYHKTVIDLSPFEQEEEFAILNFTLLNDLLNKNEFKKELEDAIDKLEKRHITDIDYDVLNANTDFQIKYNLSLYIQDLEDSISILNALSLNKIQEIVAYSYISSYKRIIKYTHSKYPEYISKIEDESLKKIILHNKINKLLSMESELINKNYISKLGSKLYWNPEKGFKVKLVKFCRLLEIKGYINEYLELGKVITFFENRYNIQVGDQRKPSKFTESEKLIEADFSFLKF